MPQFRSPGRLFGLRGSRGSFWASGVLWDWLNGSLGVSDEPNTHTSTLYLAFGPNLKAVESSSISPCHHRHPGSVLHFYNFSRCLILKVVEKTQSWASRRIYQAQQRKHNLLHWRPTLQDRKRRRYVCMLTPTTQVPNYSLTFVCSPALALSVTNTCTHSFSCVRCLPSI